MKVGEVGAWNISLFHSSNGKKKNVLLKIGGVPEVSPRENSSQPGGHIKRVAG